MTKPAVFTQADISKLLKGAAAAGMTVARVEIDRSGKIVAHLQSEIKDAAPVVEDEWAERIAKTQRAAAERH